jgi:hypothetical protein
MLELIFDSTPNIAQKLHLVLKPFIMGSKVISNMVPSKKFLS